MAASASAAATMILRVQTRDGTDRVEVDGSWTVGELVDSLASQYGLSDDARPLLRLSPHRDERAAPPADDYARPDGLGRTLGELGLRHGSMVYAFYPPGARTEKSLPQGPLARRRAADGGLRLGDIDREWNVSKMQALFEERGLVFHDQKDMACKGVRVDFASAGAFQAYLQRGAFARPRIALLFGSADAQTGTTACDVFYEPPQEADADGVSALPLAAALSRDADAEREIAAAIARGCGLECVGVAVCVTPARAARGVEVLTARETVLCAELQAEVLRRQPQIGRLFVVVTCARNDRGETEFQTYQLTDQCVRLQTAGMFEPAQPDPVLCRVREDVQMFAKGKGRQDAREIEALLLLKPVPVLGQPPHRGPFLCEYPIANRPDAVPSDADVAQFFERRRTLPAATLLRDFHLLLFLFSRGLFSPTEDLATLVSALVAQNAAVLEDYKSMLRDILCF